MRKLLDVNLRFGCREESEYRRSSHEYSRVTLESNTVGTKIRTYADQRGMRVMKAAIVAILVVTAFCSVVSAKTWHIKPDGTGDVPTIVAGVDTAASGDTLLLAPGTYTGTGNKNVWIQNKNVNVISEAGAGSTIIDCQGTHRAFFIGYHGANSMVVSGLTIENGYSEYQGGALMVYYSATPRIENSIIRNCEASDGGGIFSGGDANPIIQNNLITGCNAVRGGGVYLSSCWSNLWFGFNTIAGNTATMAGGAMYLRDAWPRIYNNTICENDAPSGAGVFVTRSDSHPIIDNTIIAFNTSGEGMVCDSGALPLLKCCDIYGNAGGDVLCGQDGGNNFSSDPQFCEAVGNGDYWLWSTSPCARDNSPCGMFVGAWPVGCDATGIGDDVEGPSRLRMMPSYPNPFNPRTTIAYEVPAGDAQIAVFDVLGRVVAVLRDGHHEEGEHRVSWDGRGRDGEPVAGGVYFVRLEAGERTQSQKILLLK